MSDNINLRKGLTKCAEDYDELCERYERVRKERDHYKKYLTILDTWEFSGRMGKREMKNLVRRTLQEAGDGND